MPHWTAESSDAFVHRIASDFAGQLLMKLEDEQMSRKELAKRLGISSGRISQLLNDPGNLELKTMVDLGRALGMKVSVIGYDDGDLENEKGPISASVFTQCWQNCGKPSDLYEADAVLALHDLALHSIVVEANPLVAHYSRPHFQEESSWAFSASVAQEIEMTDLDLVQKSWFASVAMTQDEEFAC